MTQVTPEQREAARLIAQIDRDRGRRTDPRVLAIAEAPPPDRRPAESGQRRRRRRT